jgi:hypothetical protein
MLTDIPPVTKPTELIGIPPIAKPIELIGIPPIAKPTKLICIPPIAKPRTMLTCSSPATYHELKQLDSNPTDRSNPTKPN